MKEDRLSQEELLSNISEIVFANTKLYIEEQLEKLAYLFEEIDNIKFNLATLSTLANQNGLFTEKEFKQCFSRIKESFGTVDKEGNMKGEIVLIKYNFKQ